jgi:hypothetical protein
MQGRRDARETCYAKLEALRLELHHGVDANGVNRVREEVWREVADTLATFVASIEGCSEGVPTKYNECRDEMWHSRLQFTN